MQPYIDFVMELDRLKAITRKVKPIGLDRYENSAEHSWQIALLAASLAHLAKEPVDPNRVIQMLLVHDVGEIDTGDTIVFAEGGWEERKAEEHAAVTRIFGHLPDGRGDAFLDLWREFEAGETADARFANALDRAMPALLNLANQGQSWRENGIAYERVVSRIGPPIEAGCPALWAYMAPLLAEARDKGWYGA